VASARAVVKAWCITARWRASRRRRSAGVSPSSGRWKSARASSACCARSRRSSRCAPRAESGAALHRAGRTVSSGAASSRRRSASSRATRKADTRASASRLVSRCRSLAAQSACSSSLPMVAGPSRSSRRRAWTTRASSIGVSVRGGRLESSSAALASALLRGRSTTTGTDSAPAARQRARRLKPSSTSYPPAPSSAGTTRSGSAPSVACSPAGLQPPRSGRKLVRSAASGTRSTRGPGPSRPSPLPGPGPSPLVAPAGGPAAARSAPVAGVIGQRPGAP